MKLKLSFISLIFFTFAFAILAQPSELKSPKQFQARFETSKGNFEILAERKNSPEAVDRLYQLLKSDYFNNIVIYRGVKDFVVQFGTIDSTLDAKWSDKKIKDEAVILKNSLGVMSFARAGKETRGTQLFINLKDNPKLDTVNASEVIGYPGIARITSGLDVIKSICVQYGNEPMMKFDSVKTDLNQYIKDHYPNLDIIKRAYIINE